MDRLKHWLDLFEAKTLRERLLLLVVSLAVLSMLGYLLWIGPQLNEKQRWSDNIHKVEQQRNQLTMQLAKVEAALQQDPERQNRERLEAVRRESTQLDKRLKQQQNSMISPELMPRVLEEVLADLPLVLISLHKLPPEVEMGSEVEGVPQIYRHGLRLELEGSYRDTLDYLKRLEQLHWHLAWESLDIRMKRYPKATIILDLYTLSFDEVWLGV